MLDDFSFKYADVDIETFWLQKQWPLEISAQLTDGGAMIQNKEVVFMSKLDQEKDVFIKSIEAYKQTLEKIKKFNNLENANDFSADALELREQLNSAFDKIKQFNDREVLFNQPKSEYPDLDEVNNTFKPFYELTTTAYEVEGSFKDWTQSPLLKQDALNIAQTVAMWHAACFQLNKKLIDDYPEVADVALGLRKNIEEFMEFVPLIKCVCSEAMTEEDWREI